MKYILLALSIFSFCSFAAERYEISCKNFDCFRAGWLMRSTATPYYLDTVCKMNDCNHYGWRSQDNLGNGYDVTCLGNDCFQFGWNSTNLWQGRIYLDRATCKNNACLIYGWNVVSGYDYFGGNVTCANFDCSANGGSAFWRNRTSQTVCYNRDCYHQGWSLFIY